MMVGMGNQIGFNSTLVQLKVKFTNVYRCLDRGFNSTLVQLKEGRKGIQAWNKGCFNSTLVQLKAIPSSIPP